MMCVGSDRSVLGIPNAVSELPTALGLWSTNAATLALYVFHVPRTISFGERHLLLELASAAWKLQISLIIPLVLTIHQSDQCGSKILPYDR